MKRVLLAAVVAIVFISGITSAAGSGIYDRIFGNGDASFAEYQSLVQQVSGQVDIPYPRCLSIFAGIRDGQSFLEPSADAITVYAGQYLYITPFNAAKSKIGYTVGANFTNILKEDTDISQRSDRALIAQKSGHSDIELTYAGIKKRIAINVITWRNITLADNQLRSAAFVGDVYFVHFPCTPATGYDWYISPNWSKDSLAILESGYLKASADNGQTQTEHYWLVKAVAPGEGRLQIDYRRDKQNDFNLADFAAKVTIEGY